MGKTREQKSLVIDELKKQLEDVQLAMVINYQGLTVKEITELRRQLRSSGTTCTVTKNTLMKIAISDHPQWQPMSEFLKGSTAVLLVKDDISKALKTYQDFQKTTKKTEVRGGVMEGRALNEEQLKAIGDLPSKEQLIAQVAGAINSLATKVAVGIKEVPSSLARAIQAIADKDKPAES